jgi:peptidoglycan L-alanyl-D-glutamate endopeptidase CwlK
MPFKLTKRDTERLKNVHPDLVRVVVMASELAPPGMPFTVIQGARTHAEQVQNVARGASKTMRSRHLPESNACNMSCAVDLAPMIGGAVRWDWPLYYKLAPIIKAAATKVGVPIEWGGDWKSFKDGPHFQLPASKYPYRKGAK